MNEIITQGYAISTVNPYQPAIDLVLNAVGDRTRRDYERALTGFVDWHRTHNGAFNRATVMAYITYMKELGTPTSSINQRLSAIRKLAREAEANDLLDSGAAGGIDRIPNIKALGHKTGNWLTLAQAREMVNKPDTNKLAGKRDRAVLGLLIGCGLRRNELVTLTTNHLAEREGRCVILDLEGKHNRTRTIPVVGWVKAALDDWLTAAGITEGLLFRRFIKGDRMTTDPIKADAVWKIVQHYSPVPGLAPHDLRRTFAKLAMKGGAEITQISLSLGHSNISTTQIYLGIDQNLIDGPGDKITMED